MSPQVVKNKLRKFDEYLKQLRQYKETTYDTFWEDHLKFERLFELLVMIASDIVFHIVALKNDSLPTTYRTAFLRAGELNILSPDLAKKLALAAGMRNIIVHQYEDIDYQKVFENIDEMIDVFEIFFVEMEALNI